MIPVKSKEEVACIREAGRLVSDTLYLLKRNLQPGISTWELDQIARDFIIKHGGEPAFKGYRGFPGNICTSINNVIVHGIPSKKEVVKENSIISIDAGVRLDGYFADSAYTFAVGRISKIANKLLNVAKKALFIGIEKAKADNRLSDISHAIQGYVESNGFSVVRDFVGHGIGYELHENPEVPNYGEPNRGIRLDEGMVLAIEPMVNEGKYHTKILDDGWTVVTKDGSLSSHFEHTVYVKKDKPEILTAWQDGMK